MTINQGTGAFAPADQMSVSHTSYGLVPAISRRDRTVAHRLLSAILSQWPQRTRGSPPLDGYLRRDVGLPPIEPSRTYWDYR